MDMNDRSQSLSLTSVRIGTVVALRGLRGRPMVNLFRRNECADPR